MATSRNSGVGGSVPGGSQRSGGVLDQRSLFPGRRYPTTPQMALHPSSMMDVDMAVNRVPRAPPFPLLPYKRALSDEQLQAFQRAVRTRPGTAPQPPPLSPPESVGQSGPPMQSPSFHFPPGAVRSEPDCSSIITTPASFHFSPGTVKAEPDCSSIVTTPASFHFSPGTVKAEPDCSSIVTTPASFHFSPGTVKAEPDCSSATVAPSPSPGFNMSLADLEQQLLGDDMDVSSSASQAPVGTVKTDWADVLEELLSASSPPATSTVTVEQQMMTTSTGSISDSTPMTTHALPVTTTTQQSDHTTMMASSQRKLLLACATAVSENNFEHASSLLAKLKPMASLHGDPMQRLTAYLSDALLVRVEQSSRNLHGRAALSQQSTPTDIITSMQILYRISPYYKFGYMAANSAIIEALKGEDKVHIVDFDIGQGKQWIAMIRAFVARPGGPPELRITGVAGPHLQAIKGGLQFIGKRLEQLANSLGMRFEFNPVETDVAEVEASMVERRPGEALAVNMAFHLHRVPDESVCVANPRDRLLRTARALEPRVVTVVEYEANSNTAPFLSRFSEALDKYAAVLESVEAAKPRDVERECIEHHLLARNILDIVACEGSHRVHRCEWFPKWRARLTMAGFRLCPLSRLVSNSIKMLVERYRGNYTVKEDAGVLYLGWQDTPLVVASAWKL